MKSVIVILREYRDQATPTEKTIIDYILTNPQAAAGMTIYQVAEATFSSPATITRLCKKNGFQGYREFIKVLIYELAVRAHSRQRERDQISKADSVEAMIEEVTYKNIASLENTKNILELETIEKCIKLLSESKNLCIFGIGSSHIVAKDAQQKFLRLNRSCVVIEDWHLQLLTARNMSADDLGIIISYSGQTEEMIRCAEAMKENKAKIISITRYGNSPIAVLSDYNIFVAADESTFRSGAMSSRISQLNVIDILYTGYASTQYEKSLELIERTHIRKGEYDEFR